VAALALGLWAPREEVARLKGRKSRAPLLDLSRREAMDRLGAFLQRRSGRATRLRRRERLTAAGERAPSEALTSAAQSKEG